MGGLDDNATPLGDTWRFDGVAWRELSGAGPTPRRAPAMSYAPRDATVLLFGGNNGRVDLGDTWRFDGQQWYALDVAGPTPRAGQLTAYWPLSASVVLGPGGMATAEDMWLWRNNQWQRYYVANRPPQQAGMLIATPLALLLHGGYSNFQYAAQAAALRYARVDSRETCMVATRDDDGDGLAGCADPDCAYRCDPTCAPLTSCVTERPRCGDGRCDDASYAEDYSLCPADCEPSP